MTYSRRRRPAGGILRGAGSLCALTLAAATAISPAAAVPIIGSAAILGGPYEADGDLLRVQAPLSQSPYINIGKVVLAEPAGETAMPIQVGPIDTIPRNSFVRIRGMPAAATLSEGHSIAPGSWAVPLAVLPNLRISIPVGISGKSDITIALVQIDGTVLAEARAALLVAAAEMIAPPQPAAPRTRSVASVAVSPAPGAAPPPASEPPAAKDPRALGFMVRGRAQAQQGHIAAARLFYQRAAEAGLAEGALALAGTYDPTELAALGVAGVQPDVAEARRWYEKARELGAREAAERLQRLSAK